MHVKEKETLDRTKHIRATAKNELYKIRKELNHLSLKDVKNVLIINSPPRSGSSLLYRMLTNSDSFYSLSGEAVPFYRLHCPYDLTAKDFSDGVKFKMGENDINNLSEDLLCDTFIPHENNEILQDKSHRKEYFIRLVLRLTLQWPGIKFSYDDLLNTIKQAFQNFDSKYKEFSTEYFYIELLNLLVIQYPEINPYYYDINLNLLKNTFPDIEVPSGPPNSEFLIEEPPFILLSPTKHISQTDLDNKTFLLKTSIDVHRMDLIYTLFPNANLKTIFLLRNPAGTINGLYDGWKYRGFFSHNLESHLIIHNLTALKITDYSDQFDFGKKWWNFDLPPGWNNYINKSLIEICAFQWYASALKIQTLIANSDNKNQFCIVKYENIMRDYNSRLQEFSKIFSLINCNNNLLLNEMPIIQATSQPELSRWKVREDIIAPALNADIVQVANYFGYFPDKKSEWL